MSCCHNYYIATEGGESVFSVDISSITFGHGVLKEAGEHAKALGMKRVAHLGHVGQAGQRLVGKQRDALHAQGLGVFAGFLEHTVAESDAGNVDRKDVLIAFGGDIVVMAAGHVVSP